MKKIYALLILLSLITSYHLSAQCTTSLQYFNYTGRVVHFYPSILPFNTSGVKHILDYGDGSLPDTLPSHHSIYTYASPGIYGVTVNTIDTVSGDTCSYFENVYVDTCIASISKMVDTNGLVHFSSTFNDQPQGATFYWDFDEPQGIGIPIGHYSTMQNPSHKFSTPGIYQILFDYSNSLSNCNVFLSDTVLIQLNNSSNCVPSFHFTTHNSDTTGRTLVFDNNYGSRFPSHSYSWNFGDGNSTTGRLPWHTYQNDGAYLVCLTVSDTLYNCTATFCDTVIVNQNTTPNCNANYIVTKDPSTAFGVILINTSTLSSSHSYSWDFGDGNTGTGRTPSHQYQNFGSYIVCLTITDSIQNCTSTFCDTVGMDSLGNLKAGFGLQVQNPNTVGVSETEIELKEIKLYPNPANNYISFNLGNIKSPVAYRIFDLTGKEILNNNSIESTVTIDISNLDGGIYFINFNIGGKQVNKKFIKL